MDMNELTCLIPLLLIPVLLMGWGGIGKLQRQWVVERDEGKCQMYWFKRGKWRQCKRKGAHVHHIYPQRANKRWSPHKDPHRPENLILLCEKCHNGKDGIHPDMWDALMAYRKGNKNAFQERMAERQILVESGHVYWNTDKDIQLMKTAKSRTSRFSRKKKYPEKRRKKGWKRPRRK